MIRPITPADISAIVALTEATGMFKPLEIVALGEVLADYFAMNQAEGHLAIAFEQAGVVVGYAYYGPAPMTEGAWELWWIAVAKDQQGRGVGKRLLRHLEEDIRANRRGRVLFIDTGSLPHYEPTRQFYRKQGFEEHAVLRDFYAAGDSKVIFRKSLNLARRAG